MIARLPKVESGIPAAGTTPAVFVLKTNERSDETKMKRIAAIFMAVLLCISFTQPVFAQGEIETTPQAEVEQEKLNPVIQWIADFFRDLLTQEEPVVTPDPEIPTDTPEPGETPLPDEEVPTPGEEIPTPQPIASVEEQIVAFHEEDDLGFGVMVKLLGIVQAAQAQCAETGENCDVTIDSLIAQFESGMGVGDLEETYGKPAAMGVGQVKGTQESSQNTVKNQNTNQNEKAIQNQIEKENRIKKNGH